MKGKVNKGRILVKQVLKEEKVVNGVIIPAVIEKQKTGEVVIGGEEVSVGDKIYYENDGVKLVIEGEDFVLMNERDVLYIL